MHPKPVNPNASSLIKIPSPSPAPPNGEKPSVPVLSAATKILMYPAHAFTCVLLPV